MLACITFATHRELHAFGYAFGNVYGNDFLTVHDTFTGTLLTLVLDYFAFTAAGGTGGARLHRSENGLLVADHRTAAFTSGAGLCTSVSFGAGSMTVTARHVLFQLEFLFYSGRNLLEV